MKKSLSSALILTILFCAFFTFILLSYRKSKYNFTPNTFYEKDDGILLTHEYLRQPLSDFLKKYAKYPTNEMESLNSRKALVEFIDQSRSTLGDLLNYVTSATRKLRMHAVDKPNLVNGLERLEKYSSDFVNALLVGSNTFERGSNLLFERRTKIQLLSKRIQKRIRENQETNCEERRVFLCNLTNVNGFASGIHDVLWCFAEAYHSGRRVLLLSSKWHYSHEKNWTELAFQPLSLKCPEDIESHQQALISKHSYDNDDPHRRIINRIPSDVADEFSWLGHDPLAWWYGQFIGYVLRPNERMAKAIEDAKTAIGFSSPIVGFHVRRTDKVGNEAKFHSANEYMIEARRFYDKFEMSRESVEQPDIIGQRNSNRSLPINRKVFVATDDPGVFNELKENFQDYHFIYQENGAKLAMNPNTRYSNDSLFNLIIDLYLLASSDYLICTMSSGFCRLAFELSNYLVSQKSEVENDKLNKPAFAIASSLDIGHHYAWVNAPTRVVLYGHSPDSPKQLSVRSGDVLEKENEYTTLYEALAGKTVDGFNRWRNKRTKKTGLVPDYKTKTLYRIA